jgi:hypothetical protein
VGRSGVGTGEGVGDTSGTAGVGLTVSTGGVTSGLSASLFLFRLALQPVMMLAHIAIMIRIDTILFIFYLLFFF